MSLVSSDLDHNSAGVEGNGVGYLPKKTLVLFLQWPLLILEINIFPAE